MHSPLFQILPLFSNKIQTLRKIFAVLPFPDKFFDFHPPKFLMTFFLVIDRKFRISPLFSNFHLIFPSSVHFPICFRKLTCFYMLYMYFVSPYFDHDAFMHHTMRVLDASESILNG